MSTRRQFLAAGAAMVASPFAATRAEPDDLRPVYRLTETSIPGLKHGTLHQWHRVRLSELKPGDVFRMGDPSDEPELATRVWTAIGSPSRAEPGVWQVSASEVAD